MVVRSTASYARALGLALLLCACAEDRLRVERSARFPTLVTLRFDPELEGRGLVRWQVGRRVEQRDLGQGSSFETTLWLPAGEVAEITAEVQAASGAVWQARPRRVRPPRPPAALRFELEKVVPEVSQLRGQVLLVNVYEDGRSYAAALDDRARVLWWVTSDSPAERILRVRPGRDGRSVLYAQWAVDYLQQDLGKIVRWDLGPGQARRETRAQDLHHDFVELPEGELAWLSWVERRSYPFGEAGEVPLRADALRVAAEGAGLKQDRVVFDFFEDYPQLPLHRCGHQEPGWFTGPRWWEWTHSNSLAYDEETDGFRLLPRYLDAVVEVGRDGAFRWQLGGPGSDFAVVDPFRHGHASELTGSRITVFDNGDHKAPPVVSRVVQYDVDFSTRTAVPVTRWDDPRGKMTTYLGDVATLPGGNLLVLFSPEGRLQEVTPEGRVVWQAVLPDPREDRVVGRLSLAPGLAPP